MRTDIDHLPDAKQRELDRVVQILFEEFEDATRKSTGERKLGRILKIVLYGSFARGGWVDEPHTEKGYQSDFDLLIIVNQDELIDRVDYWEKAEERLVRAKAITRTLKTPVNFIVHTLQDVNDQISHGRYFFMDIAREGIALYQADDSDLATPKPKTPQAAYDLALEYYEYWFSLAVGSQKGFHFYLSQKEYRLAAFTLHQACEQLYNCVLLVRTFYSPHVHNLNFLRTQAERLSIKLVDIWPRANRKERARFEKLKDAYVKARYSRHYRISEEELVWLGERVDELGAVVNDLCQARLAELKAAI